jgi:hypothetical protein
MTKDVDMRTGDGPDHARSHHLTGGSQLRVHAGHDEVQLGEQVVVLVEGAILVDVHLDAGQVAEGRKFTVDLRDEVELALQPLPREPPRHRQPRAVVRQDSPLVAQFDAGQRHLQGWAAAIAPVAVRVAVAALRVE